MMSIMMEILLVRKSYFFNLFDSFILGHLVAMEGHLPCLKFIVSVNRDISSIVGARNDQGDTPKSLAEQFYKEDCCTYLDALEWEQDHPEQAESKAEF